MNAEFSDRRLAGLRAAILAGELPESVKTQLFNLIDEYQRLRDRAEGAHVDADVQL